MRNLLLASVAVLALAAPTIAKADITFTPKDTGGIGEINILFDTPDTGSPIFGQIDHSGIDVGFSSLTGQTLLGSGNGQADIQAFPDPGTTLTTSIRMQAAPGTAWGDVIIDLDAAGNPCGGGTGTCGTALITAVDNMNHTFTDLITNGTNFVTMQTVPGTNEFITRVDVTESAPDPTTGNFGWTDFKQPRVSGVCELVTQTSCEPINIPEPMSLALLGSALCAFGFAARRRIFKGGAHA